MHSEKKRNAKKLQRIVPVASVIDKCDKYKRFREVEALSYTKIVVLTNEVQDFVSGKRSGVTKRSNRFDE